MAPSAGGAEVEVDAAEVAELVQVAATQWSLPHPNLFLQRLQVIAPLIMMEPVVATSCDNCW